MSREYPVYQSHLGTITKFVGLAATAYDIHDRQGRYLGSAGTYDEAERLLIEKRC